MMTILIVDDEIYAVEAIKEITDGEEAHEEKKHE